MQWNWLTGEPTTLGGLEETRITRCMCGETSFVFCFFICLSLIYDLLTLSLPLQCRAKSSRTENAFVFYASTSEIHSAVISISMLVWCYLSCRLVPAHPDNKSNWSRKEKKKKMTAYLWHRVILTMGWQTEECCLSPGQPSPSQCSKRKKSIYS